MFGIGQPPGMSGPESGFAYLLITLVVLVVLFLLLREFVCWYWKINRRIELQEEQIRLLKRLVAANGDLSGPDDEVATGQPPEPRREQAPKTLAQYVKCPHCGDLNVEEATECRRCNKPMAKG